MNFHWTLALLLGAACSSDDKASADSESGTPTPLAASVLDQTSATRMRDIVEVLAADNMGGRVPGGDPQTRWTTTGWAKNVG